MLEKEKERILKNSQTTIFHKIVGAIFMTLNEKMLCRMFCMNISQSINQPINQSIIPSISKVELARTP